MSTTSVPSRPQRSSGNEIERSAPCLNCGARLDGPFCSQCGQRALLPEPPLAELFSEAWDAFVSVDGKIVTTLRLLLAKPGALTAEYLRGRRARFVPPLRLYLLCSLAFFLIQAAAPRQGTREGRAIQARADSISAVTHADSATMARRIDSVNALPRSRLWKRMKIKGLRVSNDGKNFMSDLRAQTPRVLFVLMPVFALLLAVAYRSRRRPYASHLIVALHLHAFMFAALTIGMIAALATPRAIHSPLAALESCWMIAYVPLALRRVYGGRLPFAVGRSLALATVYAAVALLAIAALASLLVLFY